MKFGEKYELLESLTTGGVETFVANDKIRGERVLVHILECEAQKPNQPTVQWVLEAFRHIAPEPAGLVLETGRYSGTLYAYLVTKMPDEAALSQVGAAVQISSPRYPGDCRPPAKPTPESESPTAEVASRDSPSPASMPPSLRDFEPAGKTGSLECSSESAGAACAASAERPDLRAIAPAFVRRLIGMQLLPRISVPAKAEPNINSPLDSFSSAFNPPKFPSEPSLSTDPRRPQPRRVHEFFSRTIPP